MTNTATKPTLDTIATAITYIFNEFRIESGWIDGEQWAEGLAFGRYRGDSEDYRMARECRDQLTSGQWSILTARAEYMRACDGFAGFDRNII